MADLVSPTININGTSADELMELNIAAADAVRNAIHKLADASPHGRDYQTKHPAILADAHAQHVDRILKLNSILRELELIGIEIHGQRDARKNARA